jgi:2-dehydro-3-deoxyphosphogluconate aldolase / (4S)-4-hydroxy-2-oxoglutarate aldolase
MKTAPATDVAVIDAILARAPVLPVIAVERLEDAVPLARALVDGGLPVLEITLRTPVALDAIRAIREAVPDALVGAGTVLDGAALAAVQAAGGAFAIAPGCTDALYGATRTCALPFLPAVATASELMRGLEHGYRRFKFFPAEAAGGVAALRAFAGPFPQARFCPTGGIDAANAPGYLALPSVATVGGSWMLPADAIAARDWDRIAALAREAAALRPGGG